MRMFRIASLAAIVAFTACSSEVIHKPLPESVISSDKHVNLGTFYGFFNTQTLEMKVMTPAEADSLGLSLEKPYKAFEATLRDHPLLKAQSADPDSHIPASATGIPTPNPPGGVVAFSPGLGGYSGTCPGTEPNKYCGIVRLVNRYSGSVLRNAYAVLTSITAGVTVVTSTNNVEGDSNRDSEFSLPTNVGRYYYGHLSLSDTPTPSTTPPAEGFRADRVFSFSAPSVGTVFSFSFEVWANPVACSVVGAEDPLNNPYDDLDCDGIPGGSRTGGIFVANGTFSTGAPRGSDSTGDGSMRKPYATIKKGLDISITSSTSNYVYAAANTFPEIGVSVRGNNRVFLGGYDSDNGFSRTASAYTTINNSNQVTRTNATVSSLVQYVKINSANALSTGSKNSYGFTVQDSPGVLTFDHVEIHAGLGGNGPNGASGATGRSGTSGANGSLDTGGAGGAAGATCAAGGTPGAGGDGATDYSPDQFGPASPSGNDGTNSGSAIHGNGGSGGNAVPFCGTADPGHAGLGGGTGSNGSNASASSSLTTYLGGAPIYVATSGNGFDAPSGGTPGAGSGGGGAGGAYDDDNCLGITSIAGGGGGGGGAGGCGGLPGLKGLGGGASIAIAIGGTTSVSSVIFQNSVTLTTAGGGNGGNGGNGGDKGLGGLGGLAGVTSNTTNSSSGGNGFMGGLGGHGGNGSGGNGGPSICIAYRNLFTTMSGTVSCTTGSAGSGGIGGNVRPAELPGAAPGGLPGLQQNTLSL